MYEATQRNPESQQNIQAAGIILEDPALYGGEGSAMVDWARAVLRRVNRC